MRQASTLLLLLFANVSFSQQTEKTTVYFEKGKYSLSQNSTEAINNILDKVSSNDILQIEIVGHTDSDGDDSKNLNLSKERVKAVQQYFISKGVDNQKFKLNFYGEAKPLTSNISETGKQQNRRVEIVATYKEGNTANIPAWLVPLQNKELQSFNIPSTSRAYIIGKKGTRVFFPPNAFVDKDGNKISGDVKIELIEVYSKADMLLNNVQTASDGQLLESGGMVYINATSGNTQVFLSKRSNFQLEIAATKLKPDMQIFYADTSKTINNWKQSDSSTGFICQPFCCDCTTYSVDPENPNSYVLYGTKLGWINCDRFIEIANKTNLYVKTDDSTGVNYCLVFKALNAVMNAIKTEKGYVFPDIPKGRSATIVAFKKKGNERYYASKTISIQSNQTEIIALEKLSEKELQERIKEFN